VNANARLGLVAALAALLAGAPLARAQTKQPADAWVSGAGQYPRGLATNAINGETFRSLAAEHLVEQLKVRWQPSSQPSQPRLTLHFSADAPGHWPARDWRALPLTRRGAVWEAVLPVDDLDVPLVYFVSDGSPAPAILSPMRVASPRLAGMERPSRVFWPFLDGFEEGMAGWELSPASAGLPPLKTSPAAHDGNAALSVTLPVGQRAVSVGTARVRGWHYSHQLATGLRVWLRAPGGSGKARFTLHAGYGTANAVAAVSTIEAALDDKWRKVDLSFSSFPNFQAVGTDWFSIELSGEGPREFLVDDVRLLGRWKLPGE
jgi:hypothetical protein